ncbi:flagellar basal body-associated FliL family protein [Amaricoccus solimangrovi]|uniref:Flagellar protein FliL n=1 Tax=Amaricoccus solimangrovi TaxID=2589815 RepID=A0A501X0Z2_9RHOB|nr:flagellar basal body-associated FliL family protein [Amaricoccus solimangrovi]TPE53831.1 flagellar basal body-associated FliL family protein [Amaricoccus solimangrovi]
MTETAAPETAPAKGGGKGLLIGAGLALLLGGAGFGAVYTGRFDPAALLGGEGGHGAAGPETAGEGSATEGGAGLFLPLDPITVSLAPGRRSIHLRLTATIETAPGALDTVASLRPRILDALNGYLRAVDAAELEDPAAMPRLRAQMLRRVRLVGGGEAVRDILITEFILN